MPAPPRRSFWQRWFGWLPWMGTEQPQPRAPAGVPMALAPAPPGRPASPLARAYAQAAAAPAAMQMPVADAAWKVVEPEDRSDPVAHQEHQAATRNGWGLLAASVRGKMHAHEGLWREDAFAVAFAGSWAVLAVADGAGSSPLGRVGAAVACAEARRALAEDLADAAPAESLTEALRGVLARAARRALAVVREEADGRGRPLRDFHCTLLLAVHSPLPDADLVASFQVGDGCVGLYAEPGGASILGAADHGHFAGETRFLTTPEIEADLEARAAVTVVRGLLGLAVMTDGVADDFYPPADRLPGLFVGDPIAGLTSADGGPLSGLLLGPAPAGADRALADWLRYEARGSSDDRTLALLYRRREGAA
jgi:hypothetical protein